MRLLVWITLVCALLWAGWWFVGSQAARRGAEAAFAAAPAAGWDASQQGIAVAGFPNRFDLTVTAPALARDGWGWRGPFLQVFALAWRPQHLIAAFPTDQVVTLAGTDRPLTVARMQASVVLSGLALDRANLVAETVASGELAAASVTLAIRQPDVSKPDLWRIGAEVLDLRLPEHLRAKDLPPVARRLWLDAHATLSGPLDRSALTAPPRIETLEITALFAWGDLVAEATGSLRPDPQGLAQGSLKLRLTDPAAAGELLARAGLLPAGAVPPSDLTVSFTGGRTRLGPFDLGPAPRLAP
jgi:hypothetical protein